MELVLLLLLGIGILAAGLGGSDDDVDMSDDLPEDMPDDMPDDTPDDEDGLIPEPTSGDDIVTLSNNADTFDGGAGNDVIDGLRGDDVLLGGDGSDVIAGKGGADSIDGGADNDTLFGASGNDSIDGNQGFDDIYGGTGNDVIQGGFGKDLVEGGDGNDRINGEDWDDGLFGDTGDDDISGGSGDDMLIGGDGADLLMGDTGDDVLMGGAGADDVQGGGGSDLLVASQLFTRELTPDDYIQLRNDTLPTDEDGEPFFAGFELAGADASTETDTLNGGAGDDLLILGNNDIATGGDGLDDFLIGDWIADGSPAQITDFNSGEDIIFVAVESDNADAEVSFGTDGDARTILLDGRVIARVTGTFDSLDGIAADVITEVYTAGTAT